MSSYCLLAENSYVKMTYDIQGSLQKHSQVTVSIVLENQGNSVLKNMELNVLDSLNTKLARPEGSCVHDGVPVPFQLPPGISNEAQFVFTIQSIVMAQKLKGTLSFIAKQNEEGSTHEKLDFKLHFSCTSYLITTPCYRIFWQRSVFTTIFLLWSEWTPAPPCIAAPSRATTSASW
ncbi:adaptor related protein complex 3 subunit delta 1 [Rhinolophus ferrumequinum]|uniref:Adaptor related protein complex 3 subunit delta 1 n=1 Tax=Rhinolophus ferrumequinum TaxID=59479 RepID=A0A7J7TYR4_RHIFE|nr:adaptor related protein complex 3 subunit delta 1 [Rhinolophus ferrumequinum]